MCSAPNLSYLAEEKMRAWATQMEARPPAHKGKQTEAEVRPYLAVSREVGSGGSELARLVADQLGWDLLDRELLDHMAEHYDIPRDLLEFVDCHSPNWLVEIFGTQTENAITHRAG